MIQRIQSIYLLLSGTLMTLALFFPLITIQEGEAICDVSATHWQNSVGACSSLLIILFLSGVASVHIAALTIFLYKKRALQIRLTLINTLLMVAFVALATYIGFKFGQQSNAATWLPSIALSFPIVGIILNGLAIRSIKADETLVRSLDRIR